MSTPEIVAEIDKLTKLADLGRYDPVSFIGPGEKERAWTNAINRLGTLIYARGYEHGLDCGIGSMDNESH